MFNKRIVPSLHAAEMMAERGVTIDMVEETLALGDAFEATTAPGREQRYGVRRLIGGGVVRVVYLDRADHVLLVSVHWEYGVEE